MIQAFFAVKDENASHPVPSAWRPVLFNIVHCLVVDDFELEYGGTGVALDSPDVAPRNRKYVKDFGEILVDLSDDVWERSCVQWMGSNWEFVLDLSTETESVSDLVLTGKVQQSAEEPSFKIGLVYVP